MTNNIGTNSPIFDSTGATFSTSDHLRIDDDANLDSIAVWTSPGLSQDSKFSRSGRREQYSAVRNNLTECAEYSAIDDHDSEQSNYCAVAIEDSTVGNLEGGISPSASDVWKSSEVSPVVYVCNTDYEDAEVYGVLMFNAAITNSHVPIDQESPGKFNSEYASGSSLDDLLAHEDEFSTLKIVESSTSTGTGTAARRTSGRFCVKPKRFAKSM